MRIPVLLLVITIVFSYCNKPSSNTTTPVNTNLGYTATDKLSTIPASVNINYGSTNPGAAPSSTSVDLTSLFPPIGNQGQYGTCVAWASAYNLRSAVEGLEKGLNASDLAQTSHQFSPKDLFLAIPDNEKGSGCDGTNFTTALDVLQNRGVATLYTVPYDGLGNCANAESQSSWATEASQHTIKSYRTVQASVDVIKQYLASNVPLIFGAAVYDNFESWNSDAVYSSFSGSYRGGHALTIAGYDDSKNAFKIINSWDVTWGANGYIWVDYNFFVNQFCTDGNGGHPVFVIDNGNGGGGNTNDTSYTTGTDIAAWVTGDYEINYGTVYRNVNYDIYNVGNTVVSSSTPWSVVYLYYNAYNANDYGIIFEDDINTSVPVDTSELTSGNNFAVNVTIPPNQSMGSELYGSAIYQHYNMPAITGYYYLIMIAAVGNPFNEYNTTNNIFYSTEEPISFSYGVSQRSMTADQSAPDAQYFKFTNNLSPTPMNLKKNQYNSAVSAMNPNAYRPDEIFHFLKKQIVSGDFDRKRSNIIVNRFTTMQGSKPANK